MNPSHLPRTLSPPSSFNQDTLTTRHISPPPPSGITPTTTRQQQSRPHPLPLASFDRPLPPPQLQPLTTDHQSNTNSSRHLHLLAPLASRTLSGGIGIPSIRIPTNPYAGYPLPITSTAGHRTYDLGPPPLTASGYDHRYAPLGGRQGDHSTGTRSPYGQGGPKTAFLHPPSSSPYPFHLHQSTSTSHTASPSLEDRAERSPHPPLTASLRTEHQHLWPPPLPPLDPKDRLNRPYYSSPLQDIPSIPGPSPSAYRISRPTSPNNSNYNYNTQLNHVNHQHNHFLHQQQLQQQQTVHPSAPPFLPPLTHRHPSPVYIPPPLQFKYSVSPPPPTTTNTTNMPPRKRAALANSSSRPTPSSPQTISSSTSSRRKIAKGNGWTMEHTYDSVGHKKEVIVIDDSDSPSRIPKKRTRAQAAAEAAAAANGHSSINGSASATGSIKKRKVDDVSEAGSSKRPAKAKISGVSGGGGRLTR